MRQDLRRAACPHPVWTATGRCTAGPTARLRRGRRLGGVGAARWGGMAAL